MKYASNVRGFNKISSKPFINVPFLYLNNWRLDFCINGISELSKNVHLKIEVWQV